MRSLAWSVPLCALALLLGACGGDGFNPAGNTTRNNYVPGNGKGSPPPAQWTGSPNTVLTANATRLPDPATYDTFNIQSWLASTGVNQVDEGYEFSTRADEPFGFSVVTNSEGNQGGVVTSVLHTEAGGFGITPSSDSMFQEGFSIDGPGLSNGGSWWSSTGDGVSRITVRGEVQREQVLLFRCLFPGGEHVIGVRITIGWPSEISTLPAPAGSGNWKSRQAIYSSDEPGFGLPAIAVSGDRYSVTAYETDNSGVRQRRWLQYDDQTGNVTGGESTSVAPDAGSWRDQEITALNNVLAIAYTGNNEVRAEVSLDRGASFSIEQVLNESTTQVVSGQRLVQVEIAPDYTIAVAYWRSLGTVPYVSSELCVVEATPTGFDQNNTPTGYSFGSPWVVHTIQTSVIPIVMDIEYSSAGDFVIGYGYNMISANSATAEFRCCVRLAGNGSVNDHHIWQETQFWGCDPSISLIGSGNSMEIFYALETDFGIRIYYSADAGASYNMTARLGKVGRFYPSIHARRTGSTTRVDLFYMEAENTGWSLKHVTFLDYFGDWHGHTTTDLFTCSTTVGGTPEPGGAPGRVVNQVGWLGYDAVMAGDDIAVALHTQKVDVYDYPAPTGAPPSNPPHYFGNGSGTVLLPGMTGTVPAPNTNDSDQLEIIVID